MAIPVIVVGSVALDSVSTVKGETKKALGGSASHFSLAASNFAPVHVIGVVGTDFPDAFRKVLARRQINLDGLKVVDGKTFHWKGSYDKDFRNATTIATELNVFENFKPVLSSKDRSHNVVFLANIDPDLQMDVLRQLKSPRLVACDTMNYWIERKKASLIRLLKKVHILFINEEEIRQLTGQYNLIAAGRRVLKMGPRVIIIKKGDSGAMLMTAKHIITVPAFPVESVTDTTGAGDTFAGGFIGSLARSGKWNDIEELKRAMAYGTIMSSFNVEDFSVHRVSRLKMAEIKKRLAAFVKSLSVKI